MERSEGSGGPAGAPCVVTLDGPAGVGKTTLARRLADELGIAYLDSGAMFRTLALRLGEGAERRPEAELLAEAGGLDFSLEGSGSGTRLRCQGAVVGQEIRTEEVGLMASRLAAVPVVREILKAAQRRLGEGSSLVAEGRDMGSVVFPRARHKFFLDASPEVRARRRLGDLRAMGMELPLEELEARIRERDTRDRTRAVAPLRPAEDACLVDTSELDRDEVLAVLLARIREREEER